MSSAPLAASPRRDDHDEQRSVNSTSSGAGSSRQYEGVDDAAQTAEHRADDDGEQLDAVGAEAEDGGAGLVLADRGHRVAGAGATRSATTPQATTTKPSAASSDSALLTPTRMSGTASRLRAPSSPPVRSPGLRITMIEAAWANARVTMAKAIPRPAAMPRRRWRATPSCPTPRGWPPAGGAHVERRSSADSFRPRRRARGRS